MIPTFTCPKCGAVADIKFLPAYTQADLDAHEKRKPKHLLGIMYWQERRVVIEAGLVNGERLVCSCPRCTHVWMERCLNADNAPTPIFDALTAEASA